ncbi:hypothetical protein FV287_24700 [Escherichia coli]|nr:hypothetical protein FV287_24700 [Escherichia coli]HAH5440650.1 hypothetical protein [Escherichia coli]
MVALLLAKPLSGVIGFACNGFIASQLKLSHSSYIYHNPLLYAPLKRAERDSDADTAKRDVLPRKNRKDASGSFSARCIAMHESEW